MATRDELLELTAHMEWADALVWGTALQSGPARADERVRGLLHHLHTVQRAFTAIWQGAQPDLVSVSSFADLPAMGAWGRDGHAQLAARSREPGGLHLEPGVEPHRATAIERGQAAAALLHQRRHLGGRPRIHLLGLEVTQAQKLHRHGPLVRRRTTVGRIDSAGATDRNSARAPVEGGDRDLLQRHVFQAADVDRCHRVALRIDALAIRRHAAGGAEAGAG